MLNLSPQERLVHQAKVHWIIFAVPILWFVAALFFSLQPSPFTLLGWLMTLAGVISGVAAMITYVSSQYTLTNQRIIIKTGLLRRYETMNLLQRIEGIEVMQSMIGRYFGYGTIIIHGTGGTRSPFLFIDQPYQFRDKVQEQIQMVSST